MRLRTASLKGTSAGRTRRASAVANSWSVPNWDYTTQVKALNPWLYWKLDDATGTSAVDSSGNGRPGTYAGSITKGVTGALTSDTPNLAVTLNDNAACINTASGSAVSAPPSLTEIVWFKTVNGYNKGGKLLGFETPRTGVGLAGSGGTYDRHLYMDGNGVVWFGVYQGGDQLLRSPRALNDGSWHMAAATLSLAGMALYVDGALVATNADATGEATSGWWRAGCGNLAGWGDGWTGSNGPSTNSNPATNFPFQGSLDEISIWQSALTATQINFLYFTH